MRFIYFFIAGLCWSFAVVAQSTKHKADYYVLADSTFQHSAAVKLVESDKIAIKEPSGRKHTLHAGSIAWFQSAGHRYYTIKDFEVEPGNLGSRVRYGFAELLDSGQVSLLCYRYDKAKLVLTGFSGGIMPGIGSGVAVRYLLQSTSAPQVG